MGYKRARVLRPCARDGVRKSRLRYAPLQIDCLSPNTFTGLAFSMIEQPCVIRMAKIIALGGDLMPELSICPRGHQWDRFFKADPSDQQATCPVCGAEPLAETLPPLSHESSPEDTGAALQTPTPQGASPPTKHDVILPPPPSNLRLPVIEGYELLAVLGRGGMGIVFPPSICPRNASQQANHLPTFLREQKWDTCWENHDLNFPNDSSLWRLQLWTSSTSKTPSR